MSLYQAKKIKMKGMVKRKLKNMEGTEEKDYSIRGGGRES